MVANNSSFERTEMYVTELELDPYNPRIYLRAEADPRACIEKLVDVEGEHLINLTKDIARNGLTIEPILVKKEENKNIVRDGNRRVAALKLLNNPNLAPESIRARIDRINKDIVPEKIECYCSNNEGAIFNYIKYKHLGEGDGEGQRRWNSIERAFFELENNLSGQDEIAARVMRYARQVGIDFSSNFQTTTLTRLLNQERLKRIGFENIYNNPPEINVPEETLFLRLQKLVGDIKNGRVDVSRNESEQCRSLYTQRRQEDYINEISEINSGSNEIPEERSEVPIEHIDDEASDESQPTSPTNNSPGTGGSYPTRASWDRDKVIKNMRDHGIQIPRAQRKTRDIHHTLKSITHAHSTALGMLVRTFIELSIQRYVEKNNLESEARRIATDNSRGGRVGLSHRILATLNHMNREQLVSRSQKRAIERKVEQSLVVDSLNQIIHSEHYVGDKQTINTLWDDLLPILRICWND